MGDIINLRQARKQKARADQARVADANRAKFGRSKAEKQVQRTEMERQDRLLDGVRRENISDDRSPAEQRNGIRDTIQRPIV